MKTLCEFTLYDHLTLTSAAFWAKEIRNDLVSTIFNLIPAAEEAAFIKGLHGSRKILVVIAFEKPQVLEYLFRMSRAMLVEFDYTLIVCDNSKCRTTGVKEVCQAYGIPYLGLPRCNYTSHPNRSHGLAMSWVYQLIIRPCAPDYFGFLDHDMFPVVPVGKLPCFEDVYGVHNGAFADYWSMWAGYCFFRFTNQPMNFLYDFSRGLDTGGRNWDGLYAHLKRETVTFASDTRVAVKLSTG